MEKVNFTDPDTNESAEFYVLEQTTIRESITFLSQ